MHSKNHLVTYHVIADFNFKIVQMAQAKIAADWSLSEYIYNLAIGNHLMVFYSLDSP
jgi:hypothetical protein